MPNDDDITIGEVWRGLESLRSEVRSLPASVAQAITDQLRAETQLELERRLGPVEAAVRQHTAIIAWGGSVLSAVVGGLALKAFLG